MRLLITTTLVFACSLNVGFAQERHGQFPYTATVAIDESPVRSGPGENFYPVLNLYRGDTVEVWRHDPDGWYAVRPPEGAFSWISSDFVESEDGRTGTVVGNAVNVRVGSKFGDVRDAVQVRLNDGDRVDILDTRLLQTGEQLRAWLKIAPPPGEFRWIHVRDLQPAAFVHTATPVDPAALQTPVQPASFVEPPAAVIASRLDLAQVEALPADASVVAVLSELDIVLSQRVSTEPTAWYFDDLKRHGEAVVDRAESAVERSKARLFLGKLARFEDIRRRYENVAELRDQTATIDRELAATAPEPTSRTALDGTTDTTRYDGVGRLMQIVVRADGAANFALTDERGEITSYITAAPGVNLRQYIGLDVGVNGIRGYVTDERLPQVTVKRVDILTSRDVQAASRGRLQR